MGKTTKDKLNETSEELVETAADLQNSAEEISAESSFIALIAKVKSEAFKTRVVTITSNDKRDNDVTTAVILTCENQYFNLSKIVPLNIPVELEQCLIDTAKDVKIPIHTDEVINGKRTGNSTTLLINKYNISFEN